MIPWIQTGPALWANMMHLDHFQLRRLAFCNTCGDEITDKITDRGTFTCSNGHIGCAIKPKENVNLVDALFYHVRGASETEWIRVHPEMQDQIGKIVKAMLIRVQDKPPVVLASPNDIPHA